MSVVTEVVTEATLQERIAALGAEISTDYEGRQPICVAVLHGALPFLSDLTRHLPPSQVDIDFLMLTRFGHEGRVAIAMDTADSLEGRHVLLVEDIVDTGLTLTTVRQLVEARRPASFAVVTLLDKVARRIVDTPIDYRGFEVGDELLLGYGLDWEQRYRNLRSLWAVMDTAGFHADPGVLGRLVFESSGGDRLTR
ncbi:MAG: hypoxanthine phosphoribosyltransferase [Acidimicrobiia bacterium]